MDNVEPLFSENGTNMCFWQCWTPTQLQQDCIIQGGRTCFSRTVKFSVDWCIHSNTNCFLKVSQGHSQCLDVPSGSPDGCCSVSFERDWNFTQLVPPHFMSVWWCRSTSTSYMAANVTLKYIIVVKTISCHWQYGLTPQWLDTPGLRIYLMDNLETLLSNEINCLWVPPPHPSDSLYFFQMLSWSVSVRSHSNSQLHVLFQFHRFGHNPFKAQILSHRGLKRSPQSTLLGILHGCGVGHATLCSCHLCDVPLPPPTRAS